MKFGEWFIEQFGPEPFRNKAISELRDEMDAARRALSMAEGRVHQKLEYSLKHDAAIKAWFAREDTLPAVAEEQE